MTEANYLSSLKTFTTVRKTKKKKKTQSYPSFSIRINNEIFIFFTLVDC